ncbi:MAG: hypothetical protein JWN24_2474 [Phycisphaerales bacterium]|nr:hypothetical protein [Phycisphaerales bacterium]
MLDVAIDQAVARELEDVVEFGPSDSNSVEAGGFAACIGDQPIGIRLRDHFEHFKLPANLALFDRFEVWLVPHRVSIIRRHGLAEPTSVGIEIEYDTGGVTCSIASLIPSFEYAVLGEVGASVKMTGTFSPAGETNATESHLNGTNRISRGCLDFGVAAGGSLGFEYTASVATPTVSAVGIGSSRCEWRFDKAKEPLFGKDIETWSAVILPKRKRMINYRARFYLIARTLFLPTRRQSDWVNVSCTLTTPAS